MKVIITHMGLFFLVLFTFFSCKSDKRSDTPNEIIYDSISVSRIYHLENDSTKPSCSLRINYIYPVNYVDTTILSKVQRELNYALLEDEGYEQLKPAEAVDKYITDYIENYTREAKEQFPDWETSGDTEDYYSFYKTLDSKVLFDKGGLISYQVSSMDYKGGANSSTVYRNVVIDLQTGKRLSEDDIFVPDYKKMLNAQLIRKVLDQNKVMKPEDLLEFGYWGIEDLTSNSNFYVDQKGLTYIFNPGEYSAPSLGAIRILLTYTEINAILRDDSPISYLAGK
ncbi:MAG: RsiV family protein [Dysgonomonas sp.]|nr:RsiV family protein [Dysgonomonas sp.]